jgi:hypothetical protein
VSPILSTFSLGSRPSGLNPELAFTFSSSTTTTTHQFTVPAGASAGDLAMFFHMVSDESTTGGSTADSYNPSGWTRIQRHTFLDSTDEYSIINCSWKQLVVGDLGATISVADSLWTNKSGVLLVFSASRSFTATISVTGAQAGDINPAAQSLTGTSYGLPQFLVGMYGAYQGGLTGVSWTGSTYTEVNCDTGSQNFRVRYIMKNTTDVAENVTVDMGQNLSWQHGRLNSNLITFTEA